MHVPSACRFEAVSVKAYGRQLIYIKKGSGSRIESCGTSHAITYSSDKTSSSNTKTFLFERSIIFKSFND